MNCEHQNFGVRAEVNRISHQKGGPVYAYSADIKISCMNCSEEFVFIGTEAGLSPRKPMSSLDGTELRIPIRPMSSPQDFGQAEMPGYSINVWADDRDNNDTY